MRSDSRVCPKDHHPVVRPSSRPGANSTRRGAVAVEAAMLTPFIAAMLLGVCEVGQVERAQCYVSEAAHTGCNTGSLPGSSNSLVISDIQAVLTACKMTASSATITILVNNVAADVATAQQNDKISVTVAIPVSATSWTGSNYFISANSNITKTIVMMKQ